MIVPDVNLLIYAYDSMCAHHAAAARWWTERLNGDERVGLPRIVLFGFLRLPWAPGRTSVGVVPVSGGGEAHPASKTRAALAAWRTDNDIIGLHERRDH